MFNLKTHKNQLYFFIRGWRLEYLFSEFAVRLIDMVGLGKSSVWKYKTGPELSKTPVSVLCIFGDDEDMAFKTNLKESERIHKITIPGSHHYNSDIKEVSQIVIQGLNTSL